MIDVENFSIIETDIEVPHSTDLPQRLDPIFFLWFFSLTSHKLGHEFRVDFPDVSLVVVRRLEWLPH